MRAKGGLVLGRHERGQTAERNITRSCPQTQREVCCIILATLMRSDQVLREPKSVQSHACQFARGHLQPDSSP